MSGDVAIETPSNRTNDRREWVELVHFSLGDDSYMLELGRVERIVRNPTVAAVPQSGRTIAGVTVLGGVIPVIVDGRALLGLPPRSPDADSILLLLDRDNAQPTGLLVDAVIGIDSPHIDRIEPPAGIDEWELPVGRRWFRAVVFGPDRDQQTGVFDLEMLINEARAQS
jgi:chemotaxis signal transduction protein